jgi:hypothetical protein
MKIRLVTPARAGSRSGNRTSALRWARLLRELGHVVVVAGGWRADADLLFALHARKSAADVRAYTRARPDGAIVVALTGTDLYQDLGRSRAAAESLDRADRILVLQPRALDRLPAPWRDKAHVVLQSAVAPRPAPRRRNDVFEVALSCHLRSVKDPLRAALAVRRLPATSRVLVTHTGAALSPAFAFSAREK